MICDQKKGLIMTKIVNIATRTRAKFLKREAAVVRDLIANVDDTEACECEHCQPRVARRALTAYLEQLTAEAA
jgi:hypothetical protein